MKAELCAFAVGIALTGATGLATETASQPANPPPRGDGTELVRATDGKSPEHRHTDKPEKARTKAGIATDSTNGSGNPPAIVDEMAAHHPDDVGAKVNPSAAAPRAHLRGKGVTATTHYPSVIGFKPPIRIAPGLVITSATRIAPEHPGTLQVSMPASRPVIQLPGFTQSRVSRIASIGGLSSASANTSTAALNGTGMKYRP